MANVDNSSWQTAGGNVKIARSGAHVSRQRLGNVASGSGRSWRRVAVNAADSNASNNKIERHNASRIALRLAAAYQASCA